MMRTSNAMKWSVAAVVLLGLGAAVASTASAADGDGNKNDGKTGKGFTETGVRHGIRYEGCAHFELVDAAAIESWGRSNAWRFAKWLPKLDELRANPEPAIIDAMTQLFPECSWPPNGDVTFGPEHASWNEAVAHAKEVIAMLELVAVGPSVDPLAMTGAVVGKTMALLMRGQPALSAQRNERAAM